MWRLLCQGRRECEREQDATQPGRLTGRWGRDKAVFYLRCCALVQQEVVGDHRSEAAGAGARWSAGGAYLRRPNCRTWGRAAHRRPPASRPDRQTRTCHMKKSRIVAAATVAMVIGITAAVTSAVNASTSSSSSTGDAQRAKPVRIEVFAPERGANAGAIGFGWFVDMEVDFLGMNLHQAGFSGLQLTGPGVHNNAAPFPGAFSTGQDDRLPGLVVLTSTTNNTLPGFSGPGTNLANL